MSDLSKYTTGEIAKLCGVSVRTVQYYDSRGILVPSELSEGGRRLYSDENLKRMKIICFLRELDLPINSIAQLLAEEHPEDVIGLLLEQQEKTLRGEIGERQEKLDKLEQLQREIKTAKDFSVESIGDIADVISNRKKLRKFHIIMLCVGVPLEISEWVTFFYSLNTGNWWVFILSIAAVIAMTVSLLLCYNRNIRYICPKCHTVFKARFKNMIFAFHTPSARKLTCPECNHKGFCAETYRKENK